MNKLKIGSVELNNPFILAPMAGVCDLPFRLLCKEKGAAMVCTEMVSAKAIYYNNKNTKELLTIDKNEGPVSLQLFGSEPKLMAEMAKRIEEIPFDILDFNMGCPVPKVVNNGEGSALMKNPVLAGHIIEAMANAISKPVTVKIRAGFDAEHINAVEIAKIAENSGAAAITVHARTREQYYSGKADREIIRLVKEAVTIPVIGNGDIDCYESAKHMLEYTGCDGVAIGRGAEGNPWIFEELNAKYAGLDYNKPSLEEVKEMIMRHARMLIDYKGEYIGIREMRKHAAWYTAGFKGASKLRGCLNEASSIESLEEIIMGFE
ncbi:MAG: tRNA dihydrouridine synthase DusB [Lachnospiraceae bacterium]|nr:tRNA dihydrouridine synthase DusB [Lachnospiraceae bacterium]MDD7223294.1 tRNA dihydrouridine synthase DusB [Lachnospiraceae bacterium]MDO4509542.1 tRNA dihydrouridine synthase DusB [Lachnospiraceae bacterium]MDY4428204.1 tRNA dihydrouridine synthase DusB [Lachnospiraceae bacterium]